MNNEKNTLSAQWPSDSDKSDCDKKRFWLVGASQGIGKALAEQLLADGHYVVLSSRQAQSTLTDFQAQYPQHVYLLDIDVRADSTVLDEKCQQAWAAFSGLDYWFYNVAMYEQTPLPSNTSSPNSQLYEQMMQVNFYGFITMLQQLLPYFQQQGRGRFLVNGSISAHFGLPQGGAYSASKAALLNVCQSLQPELKQHGIALQIINHGFVKTRLTEKNHFSMPFLLSPIVAAQRIKQFMLAPVGAFELKFPWQMRLIFAVLKLLPYRLSLALTAKLLPSQPPRTKLTEENNS